MKRLSLTAWSLLVSKDATCLYLTAVPAEGGEQLRRGLSGTCRWPWEIGQGRLQWGEAVLLESAGFERGSLEGYSWLEGQSRRSLEGWRGVGRGRGSVLEQECEGGEEVRWEGSNGE